MGKEAVWLYAIDTPGEAIGPDGLPFDDGARKLHDSISPAAIIELDRPLHRRRVTAAQRPARSTASRPLRRRTPGRPQSLGLVVIQSVGRSTGETLAVEVDAQPVDHLCPDPKTSGRYLLDRPYDVRIIGVYLLPACLTDVEGAFG